MAALALTALPVFAVQQTWDGAASGVWDTSALNWGGAAFTSSNDALFTGTPTNNVTTATGLTIGAITLDNTFTGSVTMSGANTVSGVTTISGGTLIDNNATGLGTSAITVNSGGALNLTNLTYANAVSGAGTVNASGTAGDSILTGNWSGFTGTLNLSGSGVFKSRFTTTQANLISSSATINVNAGTTLYLNQALNYGASVHLFGAGNTENLGALRLETNAVQTGTVTLHASSSIGVNGTTDATISGAIGETGGSFGFTKVGTRMLTLSGTNTYTGGTTISAGTVQFSKLVAMPNAGAVTANGGTLAVNVGGTGEWTTGTSGNGTIGGLLAGLGGQSGSTVSWSGNSILGIDTTNAGSTQTYGNIANVGTSLGLTKLGTGTLELSGTNTYTGTTTVNAGTLNYTGAGSTYSSSNVLVGNIASGAGAVNQSAGAITGVSQLQIGSASSAYGYYSLSGAASSLSIAELDLGGFNGAPNGVMDISGGTVTDSTWFIIGRGSGGKSVLNMTGGTYNFTGTAANQFVLNYQGNAAQSSVLNVANANFTATNATGGVLDLMKAGSAGQKGIVNLLSGGVIQVQGLKASNTTGTSNFNFNGGTLKASTANASFLTGLTAANVYSGGGTIDNNGVAITVGQALLAPAGSGANSNPTVTAGGSGYIGAPVVTVSGTGGTGATAYATVSGGVVTGIVVTSPGTGYTGALSFTLTGGGGTGATIGTVTQTANTSGGMTFAGSGTTTLTGTNTYTGATIISAGTLALSGTGSINSSSGITVATGATFSHGGSVAVTSALTLAEGSALAGAGSFTPGAINISANLANGFSAIAATSGLTKSGTLTFNLTNITAGDYTLFSGGTPTGSFTGVSIASTALSSSDSNATFTGSDGTWNYVFTNATNDLLVSAIPEPATYAAILGGLVLAGAVIRRRRGQAV
jgi:autotransporter-associated beta strand protein